MSPFDAPTRNPQAEPRDAPKPPAIRSLQDGQPIVVRSAARGAFMMMSSRFSSPDWVNYMATHARGLLGLTLTPSRALELGLSLQPRRGRSDRPLYTQSIEARHRVTSGISAYDRWLTVQAATRGEASDIVTPGHVFPQLPEGKPEAHADRAEALLAAAGLPSGAMICSVLDETGGTPDAAYLLSLAARLGIAIAEPAPPRPATADAGQ